MDAETQDKIAKYLARSRQAVETGKLVLAHEDFIAAVNQAYTPSFTPLTPY